MNYYNEFDPKAAAWLKQLIVDGHIPKGEVDERSIEEVQPSDVIGFRQAHFFAGIAGWSHALRLAGVPDDEPLWTGSCPCPPFSCAGKKKSCPACSGRSLLPHPFRTGVFACCDCGHEWQADKRHLWPEFYRLIRQCKPATVYGEQVAGPDGEIWLAGVRACLEIEGYGVGASDLCSASVSAPNIRQRLYWVADAGCTSDELQRESGHASGAGGEIESPAQERERSWVAAGDCREDGKTFGLPDAKRGGCGELRTADGTRSGRHADGSGESLRMAKPGGEQVHASTAIRLHPDSGGSSGPGVRMGEPIRTGLEGHAGHGANGHEPGRDAAQSNGPTSAAGSHGDDRLADTNSPKFRPEQSTRQQSIHGEGGGNRQPDGFWDDWRIVHFTDGKTRRLKPGIEPLAPRVPGDLDLLRAYGNAINPYVASEFIQAHQEAIQAKEGTGSDKTVLT